VTVSDNDCISSGGALVAISQCSPTFVDVVFQRNSAASFGGGSYGVCCWVDPCICTDMCGGGWWWVVVDALSALYLGGETNVTFVRCSLLENSTPNDAGALWLSDTATANFVDSQFISNRAKATYVPEWVTVLLSLSLSLSLLSLSLFNVGVGVAMGWT